MKFLSYYLVVVVALLAVYRVCGWIHQVGEAYLNAWLARNAQIHQAWMLRRHSR